jgi:hypothetical protein
MVDLDALQIIILGQLVSETFHYAPNAPNALRSKQRQADFFVTTFK